MLASMPSQVGTDATCNAQVDWSTLDADIYAGEHYGRLRDDDREIISRTSTFFETALGGRGDTRIRAVDIGTGANLYPAFAALPFARRLDLIERSPQSVQWLRRQQRDGFAASWDAFIDVYGNQIGYKNYFNENNPRETFRRKVTVREGSIFDLPAARWSMGTMFFTACSLSTSQDEFNAAVGRFARSLKTRAPFAAAFMTNSYGYDVQGHHFPAVPISLDDIHAAFAEIATEVTVTPITSSAPVRDQVGMALALGFAR
jgi:hypothetical protein